MIATDVNKPTSKERLVELLKADLEELQNCYYERKAINQLKIIDSAIMMNINLIEKGLYGLDILTGREESQNIMRNLIKGYKPQEISYLYNIVKNNQYLFMVLSWFFEIED
jgi:hypothetical protein